jgi:hypothetical protein
LLERSGFRYQLRTDLSPGDPTWQRGAFQDVAIFAYRNDK